MSSSGCCWSQIWCLSGYIQTELSIKKLLWEYFFPILTVLMFYPNSYPILWWLHEFPSDIFTNQILQKKQGWNYFHFSTWSFKIITWLRGLLSSFIEFARFCFAVGKGRTKQGTGRRVLRGAVAHAVGPENDLPGKRWKSASHLRDVPGTSSSLNKEILAHPPPPPSRLRSVMNFSLSRT